MAGRERKRGVIVAILVMNLRLNLRHSGLSAVTADRQLRF
jgi:hypothetical protein